MGKKLGLDSIQYSSILLTSVNKNSPSRSFIKHLVQ
jgi:hypothetical protein